jgi:hypothetical protein
LEVLDTIYKERAKMKIKTVTEIKTKEEARQVAIDYQNWASEQSLSYLELSQWQEYFETLADKFNLTEEFKENCVI